MSFKEDNKLPRNNQGEASKPRKKTIFVPNSSSLQQDFDKSEGDYESRDNLKAGLLPSLSNNVNLEKN